MAARVAADAAEAGLGKWYHPHLDVVDGIERSLNVEIGRSSLRCRVRWCQQTYAHTFFLATFFLLTTYNQHTDRTLQCKVFPQWRCCGMPAVLCPW